MTAELAPQAGALERRRHRTSVGTRTAQAASNCRLRTTSELRFAGDAEADVVAPVRRASVDHLIPLAFGGATTEQNLQILCGPCDRRKGASII